MSYLPIWAGSAKSLALLVSLTSASSAMLSLLVLAGRTVENLVAFPSDGYYNYVLRERRLDLSGWLLVIVGMSLYAQPLR